MQVRCRANHIPAPLLSRTCVSTTYLSLEGRKIGHLFCTVIDAAHHLITESSLLRSGMSSFLSRRYGLIASSIFLEHTISWHSIPYGVRARNREASPRAKRRVPGRLRKILSLILNKKQRSAHSPVVIIASITV